ncbi:hypothetical protein Tco_0337167 [Tanacetum coccineum]
MIGDLVPNTMWSEVPVNYDKHALWEFLIGDANINNSMDLLPTGNLLVMYTTNVESLLSQNFRLSNGMATNIWIRSPLKNLNIEDRIAFGVSLRMFTRSIIIQRCVEDLQLGVESYQKKLNITKPDTLLLMVRMNEIRMEYLHRHYWRQSDKERAKAIIQAIDKQLKSRRIMRCLERFIGGRLFDTLVGNPIKEILLKLNLPDHRSILTESKWRSIKVKEFQRSFRHSNTERLSRSDKVLKLKNFKKDATLKLFKLTNQERYEHVGPEVTSSQDGKVYIDG